MKEEEKNAMVFLHGYILLLCLESGFYHFEFQESSKIYSDNKSILWFTSQRHTHTIRAKRSSCMCV